MPRTSPSVPHRARRIRFAGGSRCLARSKSHSYHRERRDPARWRPDTMTLPLIHRRRRLPRKTRLVFAGVNAYERGEFGPPTSRRCRRRRARGGPRHGDHGIESSPTRVRRLRRYVDSTTRSSRARDLTSAARRARGDMTAYPLRGVGRIETPPGGLGIVKDFESLKAHTTRIRSDPAPGR